MSFRTKGSKARAYDSTLPIEDWAKGISRALTKRKKNNVTQKSLYMNSSIKVPQVPIPLGYSATITSSRSASFSYSQNETLDLAPKAPIENWMDQIPAQKPIPARSPRRPATSGSGSPASSITPPMPSPLGSPSMVSDWQSESDASPATPDPVYQKCLNRLVNASSRIHVASQDQTSDISPLSSRKVSDENIHLSAAMLGIDATSLRSMFFGGSEASIIPRSLSSASSRSAIPAPLSLGAPSPSKRPFSIRSNETFATANEFNIEEDEEEEAEPKQEVVVPAKSSTDSVSDRDYAADDEKATVDVADTGIDEDYSDKEDTADDHALVQYATISHDRELDSYQRETIAEEDIPQDEIPKGSLADILLQVATSSPYASSDSDDDTTSEADTKSPLNCLPNFNHDASSDRNLSPTDSQPLSFPSGSIHSIRQVRPTRHYKMINGVIVEYEPWRVSGASSSSTADTSDREKLSSTSSRGFQRSGSFMRERAENRWTYTGPEIIGTA